MNYLNTILDSEDINSIIEVYEENVLLNLDEENIKKIIIFLQENEIEIISDMLINYLDLFLLDIDEFKRRFNNLKERYGEDLKEYLNYKLDILEGMVE